MVWNSSVRHGEGIIRPCCFRDTAAGNTRITVFVHGEVLGTQNWGFLIHVLPFVNVSVVHCYSPGTSGSKCAFFVWHLFDPQGMKQQIAGLGKYLWLNRIKVFLPQFSGTWSIKQTKNSNWIISIRTIRIDKSYSWEGGILMFPLQCFGKIKKQKWLGSMCPLQCCARKNILRSGIPSTNNIRHESE